MPYWFEELHFLYWLRHKFSCVCAMFLYITRNKVRFWQLAKCSGAGSKWYSTMDKLLHVMFIQFLLLFVTINMQNLAKAQVRWSDVFAGVCMKYDLRWRVVFSTLKIHLHGYFVDVANNAIVYLFNSLFSNLFIAFFVVDIIYKSTFQESHSHQQRKQWKWWIFATNMDSHNKVTLFLILHENYC